MTSCLISPIEYVSDWSDGLSDGSSFHTDDGDLPAESSELEGGAEAEEGSEQQPKRRPPRQPPTRRGGDAHT